MKTNNRVTPECFSFQGPFEVENPPGKITFIHRRGRPSTCILPRGVSYDSLAEPENAKQWEHDCVAFFSGKSEENPFRRGYRPSPGAILASVFGNKYLFT